MTENKNVSEDVEKLESTYTAGENVKWCGHFEKYLASCTKGEI